MASPLENLSGPGKSLQKEPPDAKEIAGLKRSGLARLSDAANTTNSLEGRFDLAYSAVHALCLAALRWHGYRSDSRYLVFQALPHTLGLPTAVWRVLAKPHEVPNVAEYARHFDADATLLLNFIKAADAVRAAVAALPTLPGD